jgi:hypothetical protein
MQAVVVGADGRPILNPMGCFLLGGWDVDCATLLALDTFVGWLLVCIYLRSRYLQ